MTNPTDTAEEAARAWLLEAVAFNEQRIPKSDVKSLATLLRERERALLTKEGT